MTIVIIWGNKLTMIKEAPPAVYVNQGMIFYQLKRSKSSSLEMKDKIKSHLAVRTIQSGTPK